MDCMKALFCTYAFMQLTLLCKLRFLSWKHFIGIDLSEGTQIMAQFIDDYDIDRCHVMYFGLRVNANSYRRVIRAGQVKMKDKKLKCQLLNSGIAKINFMHFVQRWFSCIYLSSIIYTLIIFLESWRCTKIQSNILG